MAKVAELSVLQVAILTPDELIHTMPRPARHGNIINRIWTLYPAPEGRSASDFGEQGFLLSDGSFADRRQAMVVARARNQLIPTPHRPAGAADLLFSEDCW